jgi:uncharacterized protein YndB with AHSA1/START domain
MEQTQRDTKWDLEVSRVIKAPVALVFQAWVDPAIMMEWLHNDDWRIILKGDFAVGSRVEQIMESETVTAYGGMEPIEIIENQKIIMRAWWDEFDGSETEIQTVTITFEDLGDNTTKLTYHNTFEKENSMGRGEKEFIATLKMFAEYIEPKAGQ